MEVADRIGQAGARSRRPSGASPRSVLEHPQLVAFGTVADLAERSGSGAATVVRLATKLGFDGFTALQASVQHDLARQLRPAAERIREPAATDAIANHLSLEVDNVRATLSSLRGGRGRRRRRSPRRRPGHRCRSSPATPRTGIATQFAADLGALRSQVGLIGRQRGRRQPPDRPARSIRCRRPAGRAPLRPVADRGGERSTAHRGVAGGDDRQRAVAPGLDRRPHPGDRRRRRRAVRQPRRHACRCATCSSPAPPTELRAVADARLDRAEAAWQGSGALVDR